MWKKMIVCLIAFAAIGSIGISLFNDHISASEYINGSSSNEAANSLDIGDEVHLGTESDDVFVVLGQKDGYLYLLKKNAVGSAVNYNTAVTNTNNYKSDANFGKIGKAHLSLAGNNIGLISKAELEGISGLVSDNAITTVIPGVDGDWWLVDKPADNRAGFVSADNLLNADGGINKTTIDESTNGCKKVSANEYGVKAISTFTADKVSNGVTVSDTKLKITLSNLNVKFGFNNTKCPTKNSTSSYTITSNIWTYSKTSSGRENWVTYDSGGVTGAVVATALMELGWRPRVVVDSKGKAVIENSSFSGTLPADTCLELSAIRDDGNTYINGYTGSIQPRIMFAPGSTFRATASFNDSKKPTITASYCPTITNQAGSALVRPYVKVKASDVIMRNNEKRTYAIDTALDASKVSTSDNEGEFLTLETSKLSVGLKSGATGVSGSVLTLDKPQGNTTITLPLSFGTENLYEGSRYVSAEAEDKDGNTVYSVLGAVGNSNAADVDIDFANLLKSDSNSFKVTLYLEDSGNGNTAYRSMGTQITVNMKSEQSIDFDVKPDSLTYGTCDTITARLTSNVSDQSNEPLLFSLPADSMDKVKIQTQSYDPNTGLASATICPKNGDTSFEITIDKAGDAKADAAESKTTTITLNKAPLKVYPQIIYGKTKQVGDMMPELLSITEGLVNEDKLPNEVHIELTPDASTAHAYPNDTGNSGDQILYAGTWEMRYPANILTSTDPNIVDFVKKYEITLEDYGIDPTHDPAYLFKVAERGIPDSYVIVSPAPNADGWNKDDVMIALSQEAKDAGWTSLTLIRDGAETTFGESISITNETNGMMPIVVLKQTDDTKSDYKSVRNVKLDKGKPTAAITIDHQTIWTNTDKNVSITVHDAMSGVKSVKLTDEAGTEEALTQEGTDTYSFVSDNGKYRLTITDYADNENDYDISVERIDKTAPVITATLGNLSGDNTARDIDVTATVGPSGVQSFTVYYKKNAEDSYPNTGTSLDQTQLSQVYSAQKNGFYRFEIINNLGEKASAEVEVSGVAADLPVIEIQAVLEDASHSPYPGTQWVNKDVVISVSNVNSAVTESITYQYKKIGDTTWTTLDGTQLKITENAWQNETYEFRGVIGDGAGLPSSINVRIDKEKPQVPNIDNVDDYTADNAFATPLDISASTIQKSSGIGQKIMVSSDHGITWNEMIANIFTLTEPAHYTLSFKTVDEAGNESDEFTLNDVIVNDGTPQITIKLNHNPLKDIVHHMTLGYLFKEHVDVVIEVNWYGMKEGNIYYILDDSATANVPTDDDARWTSGSTTSIDPDRKTMIYVKAVNSDGKIARASSTYYVIADETAPTITFDKSYENWSNDQTLTAQISDSLSGINNASVEARIDHSDKGDVEVKGNTLKFSSLPDGNYKLQVSAEDNSGNKANEIVMVKIDTKAPMISGVKDQSVYHHYYLPRYVTVEDKQSGIAIAQIKKDGGEAETINESVKVEDIGAYEIYVKDQAGNEDKIVFRIVPLPDITTEIGCDEESRKKIEQIEKEYADTKDHMDETERNSIQKWLEDAHDVYHTCRIKIVYNEDKSAWIEGLDKVDFAPDVVLVVEDIETGSLPTLPMKAKAAYNVYLKQGDHEVEPTGMVKIHLPYDEAIDHPILYEINESHKVKEISVQQEERYLIFEADTLLKYAIANKEEKTDTNIDIDDDGCPDLNIVWTDEQGKTIILNEDKDGDHIPDYNIDIDGDGKPDLNIDTDKDEKPDLNLVILKEWKPTKCITLGDIQFSGGISAKAEINIDTDGDLIPDINIDNQGDFKPHINISKDGKEASVNLADIHEWKPDKNYKKDILAYDSIGEEVKPQLNIDTDGDGRSDTNIDLDKDRVPDLNIDTDGDLIPDLNIDSTGDGKANINVDRNDDGIPDENLMEITEWKPEHNVDQPVEYDTMKIENKSQLEDNGITIEKPNKEAFLPNMALKVIDVTKDKKVEVTNKASDLIKEDQEVKQVFDVKLLENGIEVKPDGTLKIRIPIKEGIVHPLLLRQNAAGESEIIDADLEDGYLVYESDSLGLFAIIADIVEEQPNSDNEIKGNDHSGNNSGGAQSAGGALTADTTNIISYMGALLISMSTLLSILYTQGRKTKV